MKRVLAASGALVAAILVPLEVVGGLAAEAAAWATRFVGSKHNTAEASEDEVAQVAS